MDEADRTMLEASMQSERSVVVLVPHFSLMEMITAMPLILDYERPAGVIYRPLGMRWIERWVKRTRERFGLKLLSRKEGFLEAQAILRQGGAVAVLFDQNAGARGLLTTFCGRLASTTELPGLLAEKFQSDVFYLYTQRLGFMRAKMVCEPLIGAKDAASITYESNRWLEHKLRTSTSLSGNWLWMHSRWRTQDEPRQRLRIQSKKDRLVETLAFLGQKSLERKTRFWIRMPNWLGDVVMAIPLIRALEKSRPDAEITLLARAHFIPLLKALQIGHKHLPLPQKGWRYYWRLLKYRNLYPETYVTLPNSLRSDFEAFFIGAPQRFGIERARKRPFLTHTWRLTQKHQTERWVALFQHFGLLERPDLSPLESSYDNNNGPIGCICGTENFPAKRWPVEHWRTIIQASKKQFVLFGTQRDVDICNAVAHGLKNVENRAGQTDLVSFAAQLKSCSLVITNDTGGMHLANALGVPIVALFGPTDVTRTGPIFSAPKMILKSSTRSMADIEPKEVFKHITGLL
ncbi:MAG: hypothetical protein A2Y14_02670 [Verrucomicrobia bacterium GWF2_51_19]|nr:MAG: hypothetical protein A2Y14_02670 [Verrucomicrobia bacterium GWF2_51_19]